MESTTEARSEGAAVALTSRWIAAARAHESARDDRLFYDPFADSLARVAHFRSPSSKGRPKTVSLLFDSLILRSLRTFGSPYLAIRTRFFDDLLVRATHIANVRQVVILAAGLDTRAFRLSWPSDTHVYELDRPEVLNAKEEVLMATGTRIPHERRTLGVDLTHPSWPHELREAGYNVKQPSAWLIEGLFMYLSEAEAQALLTMTANLAAPGSWLGADLVNSAFLTSPLSRSWLRIAATHGAPWRFGADLPEALFASHGWEAAVTQPGETGANYHRWPFGVASRRLPRVPRLFLVAAQRSSSLGA
jgi:methyltransferase (TIGR00027 family)